MPPLDTRPRLRPQPAEWTADRRGRFIQGDCGASRRRIQIGPRHPARQIPETSTPQTRSPRGRCAGPNIAVRWGMRAISLFLLAASIALGPACGSQSLGPTGPGGPGTGGGPGAGGGREGSGTGGSGAASGTGGETSGSMDAGTSGLNGPCKNPSDCQLGTTCAPPGFPGFCGICFTPAQTCLADSDCTGTVVDAASPRPAICDPDPVNCTCDGAKTCQAGCISDSDCATGLSCGSDHHCAPTACTAVSDACPVDFSCGSDGHCARNSCTSDAQCSSACVLGACYSTPGYCAGDVA